LWEFYQATINGESVSLEEKTCFYYIDYSSKIWLSINEWCREVIWNVDIGHVDQNKALLRQPLNESQFGTKTEQLVVREFDRS
jgi:hypothetical protein